MKSTKQRSASGRSETVNDACLSRFAGYHLKRAFNTVVSDVNRTLKPYGLRMVSYSVLAMIAENSGLRQTQLAEVLAIERPNLVVILDDLESRDLIARERVPTDRRAYALSVTETGMALYKKALASVKAHDRRLFGDLDAGTRAGFVQVLKQVRSKPESETS